MTTTAQPIEVVDLSDLDLLDDPERHIFCVDCNGHGPGIAIAVCGKRAMSQGILIGQTLPPDLCPACAEGFLRPCARCHP